MNFKTLLFIQLVRFSALQSTTAHQQHHRRNRQVASLTSLNNQRLRQRLDINHLKLPPIEEDAHFSRIIRGGGIQNDDKEQYNISLSPLAFCSIFGFLGGWTQIICNQKFDIFTAMMTGHFLNMSILLAEKQWKEMLWRVCIILSYVGGTAFGRSIEVKYERLQLQPSSKGVEVNQSSVLQQQQRNNAHFKILAPLVFIIFAVADGVTDSAKISLLAFGNGLIYPSVSYALGGTITHLMTGHTTNCSRLIGGKQVHHKGMKTSLCILGSIIAGGVFGTKVLGLLGDEFPYFSILGFFYGCALLLLL